MEESRNLNHHYVGTEHLLLGFLRDGGGLAAQVLTNLNLQLDEVRQEVLNLLGHGEAERIKNVDALAAKASDSTIKSNCGDLQPICDSTLEVKSPDIYAVKEADIGSLPKKVELPTPVVEKKVETKKSLSNNKGAKKDAKCSFCHKSYRDVGPLIEGHDKAYICGECIDFCQTILAQERRRRGEKQDSDDISNVEAVRFETATKLEKCLREANQKIDEAIMLLYDVQFGGKD